MSSIPAAIIPAVFRVWVQHPEKPMKKIQKRFVNPLGM